MTQPEFEGGARFPCTSAIAQPQLTPQSLASSLLSFLQVSSSLKTAPANFFRSILKFLNHKHAMFSFVNHLYPLFSPISKKPDGPFNPITESSSIFSPILAAVPSRQFSLRRSMPIDETREESDPGHFNLRFIVDDVDISEIAASVFVQGDVLSEMAKVTFPGEGYVFWFGSRNMLRSYFCESGLRSGRDGSCV